MQYRINLMDDTIEELGKAVGEPIQALEQDILDKEELIEQKDAQIAQKDATIAEQQAVIDAFPEIEQLTVTASGTYQESGKAYTPVIVDIETTVDESTGVNFYDYDGTLVQHYDKNTFLTLTAMPANPTHTGLTAQGWNWSLSDAQAYIQDYDLLNIGQMYITESGATELYISIATDGRMVVPLHITQTVSEGVSIDWGDGSTSERVSGTGNVTATHTYASVGDYVIKLLPDSGVTMGLGHGSAAAILVGGSGVNLVYSNMAQEVRIGSGVTRIGSSAFNSCYSLASVTIPDGVTGIANSVFQNCYSLGSVTIPDGVTSIGSSAFYSCYSLTSATIPSSVTSIGYQAFQNCYSLASVTIPDNVTGIGNNTFQNCYNLASVTIPDTVTSIGNNTFQNCYSLTSVTIPSSVTSIGSSAFYYCTSLASVTIPDSVTSIGSSAFQNCTSLASVTIPDTVTSIGSSAFNSCYNLASVTIPDTVTSIGSSAFQNCTSLASVTIPDGVTDIGSGAFATCYSLASVTIPDTVTSIGSSAFQNCYGVVKLVFEPTTPPTIVSANAFSNLPTDCIILVPSGTLSAYTSATNYPSSSTYTYQEY